MLLVTSGANKDSRPLITSQEIDEETAREIPGLGAHGIQMSSRSQMSCLTVLLREEARCWRLARTLWHCPQRLAVGQARLTASRSVSLKCVSNCFAMATP
jgi:hypothetical protein